QLRADALAKDIAHETAAIETGRGFATTALVADVAEVVGQIENELDWREGIALRGLRGCRWRHRMRVGERGREYQVAEAGVAHPSRLLGMGRADQHGQRQHAGMQANEGN